MSVWSSGKRWLAACRLHESCVSCVRKGRLWEEDSGKTVCCATMAPALGRDEFYELFLCMWWRLSGTFGPLLLGMWKCGTYGSAFVHEAFLAVALPSARHG